MTAAVTHPFFTVGHSNRSLAAFMALLAPARIALVVDIRKIPRSKSNPQFNQEALGEALESKLISYEHLATLGGLRGKALSGGGDLNALWTNQSFRNYADYALTEPFQAGLEHLFVQGRARPSTVMCSEAVWWRCHRRIVADHLIARGQTVFHIMGEGRLDPARLTPGAVVRADRTVVYPRPSAAE